MNILKHRPRSLFHPPKYHSSSYLSRNRLSIRKVSSHSKSESAPASRLARLNNRLPKFLRRFTTPLLDKPLSHISSFLILHELTAIVPLFGFAGLFHYTEYVPPFLINNEMVWVNKGMEKFGRYFRRKGWISDSDAETVAQDRQRAKEIGAEQEIATESRRNFSQNQTIERRTKWYNRTEGGVRLVTEFAMAYAITKALMPLRLILSAWATPWFAQRVVVPFTNIFRQRGLPKSTR